MKNPFTVRNRFAIPALAGLCLLPGIPAPNTRVPTRDSRNTVQDEVPGVVDLKERLLRLLGGKPRPLKKIEALVAALEDRSKAWTENHYLAVSKCLLDLGPPRLCARAAEAGLKRFPKSRFLLDNRGMAYLRIATETEDDDEFAEAADLAEESFLAARKLPPKTFHASFGLFQLYRLVGEDEDAWKALSRLEGFREWKMGLRPFFRFDIGQLLIGRDRFEEALRELEDPQVLEDHPLEGRVLLARVRALLGKTGKALETSSEAVKRFPGEPSALAAHADLLAELGKRSEALKLLGKPRPEPEGEEDADSKDEKKSLSCLTLLLRREKAPPEKLRKDLTRALGHRFLVIENDEKTGKPKQTDVISDPYFLLQLLEDRDDTPVAWVESLLKFLAVKALPAYKESPREAKLRATLIEEEKLKAWRNGEAIEEYRKEILKGLADPDFAGAFLARRLLKRWE